MNLIFMDGPVEILLTSPSADRFHVFSQLATNNTEIALELNTPNTGLKESDLLPDQDFGL